MNGGFRCLYLYTEALTTVVVFSAVIKHLYIQCAMKATGFLYMKALTTVVVYSVVIKNPYIQCDMKMIKVVCRLRKRYLVGSSTKSGSYP